MPEPEHDDAALIPGLDMELGPRYCGSCGERHDHLGPYVTDELDWTDWLGHIEG